MKHYFSRGVTACLATAVSTASLVIGISQPSPAAFPGRTFGCSNPGSDLQTFPGSSNALIATPDGALPGFPVQTSLAVFGDVFQANGLVATGETRCFQAMQRLNELNTPNLVGTVAITYQPLTNGERVTGATICLVPIAAAGIRNCGVSIDPTGTVPPLGHSFTLFTISQNPRPVQTAANIAEKLGSLGLYVNGSSISGAQVDGRSRI